MFGIKMFYNMLQRKSFDPDYQAILNYATSQGWSLPSTTNQTKDNTLILSLKSAGIWNKLDIFYMFSTDYSDFARINWKSPGNYTATLAGNIPPAFVANVGFSGASANLAYIRTNFIPLTNGVNYTLNNASRNFWKINTTATSGFMDGNSTATYNGIQTSSSTNQRINSIANTGTAYAYGTAAGMKSIHRTSSTSITLFQDTTSATRTVTSSSGGANSEQWILRSGTTYTSHRVSMYSMGASLVNENTDYYNAINTRLS